MSDLTRRVLFAVVAAPVALVSIWAGGAVLATLLATLAAVSAWEFCRMARAAGAEPLEAVAIPAAAAVPVIVHGVVLRVLDVRVSYVAIALLAVFAASIWARGPARRPLVATAVTAFGVAYVSLISYVYVLRYHDFVIDARGGTALAALPVVLVWATDIGAFAVGRAVGGPRLIPSISPGKTVSGAVGGMLLAAAVALAYVPLVLRPLAQVTLRPITLVAFGLVISAVAQLGDLAESLLKREARVKDSSTLLPGHGGLLDRLDSLVFALPVAAVLLRAWLVYAPT